uniref:Uncharacterized protein n=1 Tax=Arion vulgaris TaxID=1028688 RepID=A0A0B7B4U3_9EUPU
MIGVICKCSDAGLAALSSRKRELPNPTNHELVDAYALTGVAKKTQEIAPTLAFSSS